MGTTYATIKLTNLLNRHLVIEVKALVDTGATFLCVPNSVAIQLGFDPEEMSTTTVTLADGSSRKVPRIGPIEIVFSNRTCMTEALVLGDEALMGVLPLEAMDLLVDPLRQQLIVNPEHPNFPVYLAK